MSREAGYGGLDDFRSWKEVLTASRVSTMEEMLAGHERMADVAINTPVVVSQKEYDRMTTETPEDAQERRRVILDWLKEEGLL